MKFLDLINLTLQELNYKTVSDFSELVKPDHKKVSAIVSRVNDIMLGSADWQFLMRELDLEIPANASRVSIPRWLKIKTAFVNGERFHFTPEFERHLNGRGFGGEYAIFGSDFLVAPRPLPRSLKIVFKTANTAKDSLGNEIPSLKNGDDESLMPDVHARSVIVFGACMQFKSDPSHPRYKHWLAMFSDAHAQMRASAEYVVPEPPRVKLPRWVVGFDRY